MTTDVATRPANLPALHMDEGELLRVLSGTVYPGARTDSVRMVLAYCKARSFDPMLKPVHIVPMKVTIKGEGKNKDEECWRDVVMPGIGLYRIIAARTGQFAGADAPIFGPMQALKMSGQDEDGNPVSADFEYPEWCEVTVYRMIGGNRCGFTAREFWLENYATAKNSKMPNAMWKKRKHGQIAKCAEAQALRKAFPEVGSDPTADEMEGKPIDTFDGATVEAASSQVQMPKSKREVAANAAPETTTDPVEAEPQESAAEGTTNEKPTGPLANAGMMRVVRAKLKNAGKTEEQMTEHFGYDVDHMPIAAANDVMTWASA